ncbi:MAG: hypothetical protein EXR95_05005 [Gemmatimonadetes bacterium]|nr:hypothetical protein [Gemmatimonadota bacterium]
MERRGFLRRCAGAATFGPWARRPADLVRWLRRDGAWAARLDDPAYGGRGDGVTLNDEPLLQALADMPLEGGTLVIPPAGDWLFDAVDLARVGRRRVRLVATGARVVKSLRTATHLFRDEHGTSDGLTVVGGSWELSAAAFRKGQSVSAFFLVRADDLAFVDVTVRDGIEEGLKLYTPRRLRVLRGAFERLVNNGVQIHAPEADGFRGNAPERDTDDVVVEGAAFRAIDDGLHGMEGQGVSVSGASRRNTASGVLVTGCTFERCVRGAWAEFNEPGLPGRDIRFDDNLVVDAECHGLGLVGVRGGGMRGNHVLDTGGVVPGRPGVAASEIAGLVLSGSERTPGEDLVVEDNEVVERRTGAAARMQYGILARRQRALVERRNVVRGATVRGIEVEDRSS